MSKREIKDYLQDILDGIDAAESFVEFTLRTIHVSGILFQKMRSHL